MMQAPADITILEILDNLLTKTDVLTVSFNWYKSVLPYQAENETLKMVEMINNFDMNK